MERLSKENQYFNDSYPVHYIFINLINIVTETKRNCNPNENTYTGPSDKCYKDVTEMPLFSMMKADRLGFI